MVFNFQVANSSLPELKTPLNFAYAKVYVSKDIETKERAKPAHAFKKRLVLKISIRKDEIEFRTTPQKTKKGSLLKIGGTRFLFRKVSSAKDRKQVTQRVIGNDTSTAWRSQTHHLDKGGVSTD